MALAETLYHAREPGRLEDMLVTLQKGQASGKLIGEDFTNPRVNRRAKACLTSVHHITG